MNSTTLNITVVSDELDRKESLLASIAAQKVFLAASFLVACLFYAHHSRSKGFKLPLPPGPPGWPVIGNLLKYPDSRRWLTEYLWKFNYGPLVYLNILGKPMLVLTTVEATHELLNKRAAKYSGRDLGVMAGDLVSKGYNLIFRQYDAQMRLHQRLNVAGLNPRSAALYDPVLRLESLQLLHDILTESRAQPGSEGDQTPTPNYNHGSRPFNPRWYFQRANVGSLHVILYGDRLVKEDPTTAGKMDFLLTCPTLQALQNPPLVDIFPWLKSIPYALSPWKLRAESMFKEEEAYHLRNLRNAVNQPGYNVAKQVADSAKRLNMELSDTEISWVIGTLFLANGDTSPTFITWFLVMMINYPRVMHKAQQVLDEVVGRDRLPTHDDRSRMPYIDAIIDEVMRYRPVVPSGVDHLSVEEDEYMGCRIPKGTIIVTSQFSLARDKAAFGADAEEFRPERWLERSDLPIIGFGNGRRVCPGRHVAKEILWIMVTRLLWAYEMEAPIDPETKKRKIIDDRDTIPLGIVIGPSPFEAVFTPRGKWVEDIIENDFKNADFDVNRIMEDVAVSKGL
ncbi:Cytochrome P450 monooxygenase COX2 [Colletotrichum sp. SAR 10_76]|nr:Cytochrome P450 monooxygenase COX2 [Colletotrichum sp. SAR 10_76]